MTAELKLDGMDQLLTDLQSLGERASRVENQALQAGAVKLQKAIAIRAPRSKSAKEHAADHVDISKVKVKDGIKTVTVGLGSKYFYMKFLEYGTSKLAAKPFMGPAVAESQKDVLDAMADVLRGAINSV